MIRIVFYLIFSLSTSLNAQQELRHIDTKLDSIFGHYNNMEKPGVSIAIMENNKPTIFKSYGYANLEYKIKNSPHTLYNSTDLAKQFTIFSILMLQEEGKLTIDDNIKKYLPLSSQWPFEITLKHLMEQTSGLRDVMDLKKWIGYQNGDVVTKQDILDISAKQRNLNFPSGSKFEYNRTGFVLLTEVIANVSGMPFSEFVNQRIFTPLEMKNSEFVNTHTELIQNRSYSYALKDNRYTKVVNNSSFVGGTNLYTSTSDFAKWLKNMSKHRIGKPSSYEYIHTKIKLPNGQTSNYTPGLYKDDREGYLTIHLEGFDHGCTSYMMYLPAYDFSMVFFSNDIDFPIDDIFKTIYGWFNSTYSISPVESNSKKSVKFVNKSSMELQNYTGNYLFEDSFSLRKIVLENDTLFYERSETNRTPMVPIEGTHTFKMIFPGNDNVRVTFANKGEIMEYRSFNAGNGNDYVSVAREIEIHNDKQIYFSGDYRNEELGHSIGIQNVNDRVQLTMDGASIVLDQIGDNEFLSASNSKVKYVKLQRDEHRSIIGVYLSDGKINNLYYRMISN